MFLLCPLTLLFCAWCLFLLSRIAGLLEDPIGDKTLDHDSIRISTLIAGIPSGP